MFNSWTKWLVAAIFQNLIHLPSAHRRHPA